MTGTRTIFVILFFQISISVVGQITPTITPDSTEYYFPLEVFTDTSISNEDSKFVDTWYSSYLLVMEEPKLFLDTSQNEIYRFTWLRTFHNPVTIRIEKQGDTYLLFWKLCNGRGGYEPGQLTVNKQKTIDKTNWDKFKNKLNQIDFWNAKPIETEFLGTDGAQWILEGKSSTKYHVVNRWSPNETGNYYQCCDFLIELTDLKIKSRDKY